MSETPRIRYRPHAREQMTARDVTEEQVERRLRSWHTTYPAERLSHLRERAIVFVSNVDGRELNVYVVEGSDPPIVRTVVWRD